MRPTARPSSSPTARTYTYFTRDLVTAVLLVLGVSVASAAEILGAKLLGEALGRAALGSQQHNTIKLTGRLIEDEDWTEARIDRRTSELIDVLLRVWPVPEGHEWRVVDPQTKAQDWVELKHLIEGRQLSAGDVLIATHRDFGGVEGAVTADGHIELDGKRFRTPSGAARHGSQEDYERLVLLVAARRSTAERCSN